MLERLNATLAGRYTVERELGRGGMASVWLARDLRHQRPVAIKVLRAELAGAIGVLQLLSRKGSRLNVLIVSDSEYLVRGVREWMPGWRARGWKRKTGEVENLDLWRALEYSLTLHDAQFAWVRGHNGHPKNEYANDLAVAAAKSQTTSDGVVPSGFDAWLSDRRAGGEYLDYDPDGAFTGLAERLRAGERFPLDLDATTPLGG